MAALQTLAAALVALTALASSPAQAQESLEHKLAVVEAGGYVPADHITVARFGSLLNQLSGKYRETPQQVADMTVKARGLLREEGVSEQMVRIMEGMNTLFSTPQPNMQYAEYVSAYIVLRKQGQPHDEAISGLRAILNAMGIY